MHFIFDIDGTICFDGQTIERRIEQALQRCLALGHSVTFASARPIRDLLPVLPTSLQHCSCIGGNGAFLRQQQGIRVTAFSEEIKEQLQQIITQHQLTYLVDSDWDYCYTGSEQHVLFQRIDPLNSAQNKVLTELTQWTKLILFTNDAQVFAQVQQLGVACYVHDGEQLIDISPANISKWHAAKQLGMTSDSVIAFGNDQNDLSLFQHAHQSVCVGSHAVGQAATMRITRFDVAQTIQELAQQYALQL